MLVEAQGATQTVRLVVADHDWVKDIGELGLFRLDFLYDAVEELLVVFVHALGLADDLLGGVREERRRLGRQLELGVGHGAGRHGSKGSEVDEARFEVVG